MPASRRDSAHLAVEVMRGAMVESRHAVEFAVSDASGRIVQSRGEIERPVYGRSAIKPLQALPLIETGAAERYELGNAEIALACSSHSGEPRHVSTVTQWLERIGLAISDLECGSHLPYHEPSAAALIRAGLPPSSAHDNCSGKHTGFLTTALHKREPTRGYIGADHPVQRRVTSALEEMCGSNLAAAPRGIDGCGIPVIGIPLAQLALGMARLADPERLSAERKAAARRIAEAMAVEPFMVAGTGRFTTVFLQRLGRRLIVKSGAEGVFCLALPELGLGAALKALDGAGRAAEAAAAHLLQHLGALSEADAAALQPWLAPQLRNRAGRLVGTIRVPAGQSG